MSLFSKTLLRAAALLTGAALAAGGHPALARAAARPARSAGGSASRSVSLPFEQHTLRNGLRVLTLEDHSVPAITYWTWFHVGSINERPGITGISHLFEHLMFRGAKKYGPGEFDKILESSGGYSNAFTAKDMTAYYEDLISDKAELAIDLDADRMASLQVTQEVLDPEREVVKEERRFRSENDVAGAIDEVLDAAAYEAHPYGWPVVGWMGDLNNITVEDCRDYFRTYYAPNNATIIAVGDFRTADLLRLIERYYAAISSHDPPRPVAYSEPAQRGQHRVLYHKEAQVETVAAAWHVPQVDGPHFHAMEVLQYILGQGRSSRLYKRLVYDTQIALNVSASNEWQRHPGLFKVYVDMNPGRTAAEGEKLVDEEIAKLRETEIPATEIQKAKNNIRASFLRQMKTNNGKGQVAGQFEIQFGDWRKHAGFLDKIDAVTPADLKNAANRYLIDLNKTVVTLVPKDPPEELARPIMPIAEPKGAPAPAGGAADEGGGGQGSPGARSGGPAPSIEAPASMSPGARGGAR